MFLKTDNPRTIQLSGADDYLYTWLEAFLIDRKASGVAEGTLHFYRQKIKLFLDYCETQAVTQISQINSSFLRQFLLILEQGDTMPGGDMLPLGRSELSSYGMKMKSSHKDGLIPYVR